MFNDGTSIVFIKGDREIKIFEIKYFYINNQEETMVRYIVRETNGAYSIILRDFVSVEKIMFFLSDLSWLF